MLYDLDIIINGAKITLHASALSQYEAIKILQDKFAGRKVHISVDTKTMITVELTAEFIESQFMKKTQSGFYNKTTISGRYFGTTNDVDEDDIPTRPDHPAVISKNKK